MNEKILTKEEHIEKLNQLIKPVIDMAIDTEQFKDNDYYVKEFVVDEDDIQVLIIKNRKWIAIENITYIDMYAYRSAYFDLEAKYEELKEECEKYKHRKKWFGIF